MKKLLMTIPALCLGLVLTGCGETDTPAPATNGTEAAGTDSHTDEATDMGAEAETPAGEMPAAAGGTTEGEAAPDAPPAEPEEKL
ncbi:MAG: hypothetical protein KDA79_09860, partial [Planctomycetaceae bacterium]|nr:hypothetical protein [Planctomycetaceae bacterium]